jgi:hypothetical protein
MPTATLDEKEAIEARPSKSHEIGDSDAGLSSLPDSELQKLNEQELKAAIIAAWKKHEALAKAELAPLLYWLRERLRAQGARNDIADKDRGWGIWVEEHLDISRRTADRWCEWYAVEAGLKEGPTSGQVSKSDEELYEEILDAHDNEHQIAFNYWVKTAVHAQFQRALTKIQNRFGLKDKKEALVRGVIYAASVVDKGATNRGSAKNVGYSLRKHRRKTGGHAQVRARVRSIGGRRNGRGSGKAVHQARP